MPKNSFSDLVFDSFFFFPALGLPLGLLREAMPLVVLPAVIQCYFYRMLIGILIEMEEVKESS